MSLDLTTTGIWFCGDVMFMSFCAYMPCNRCFLPLKNQRTAFLTRKLRRIMVCLKKIIEYVKHPQFFIFVFFCCGLPYCYLCRSIHITFTLGVAYLGGCVYCISENSCSNLRLNNLTIFLFFVKQAVKNCA